MSTSPTPRLRRAAVFMTAAAMLAACSETPAAPAADTTRVFVSATPLNENSHTAGYEAGDGALSTAAAAGQTANVTSRGTIPLSAVDSINITLVGVAVIQPADTVNFAMVLDLSASARTAINFRTLPALGTDSVEVARGSLPAGTYETVRMRFSAASITFNETVAAGGIEFPAGTYPLEMSQGIEYAIQVPTNAFTITGPSQPTSILVEFDAGSSVATIVARDSILQMRPVLRGVVTTGR